MNPIKTLLLFLLLIALALSLNPYKVLGIPKTATDEQIKKAFNKKSKKYHPDRNTSDPRAKQKFEKVVEAY